MPASVMHLMLPTCYQILQLDDVCLLAHSLTRLLTAAVLWCANQHSPHLRLAIELVDCVQAKGHEEAMNQLIKAGYIKTCTEGRIHKVRSSPHNSLHPL